MTDTLIKRFRSNSTEEKNAAYIFKNIGMVMNDTNPQIKKIYQGIKEMLERSI